MIEVLEAIRDGRTNDPIKRCGYYLRRAYTAGYIRPTYLVSGPATWRLGAVPELTPSGRAYLEES